MCSKWPPIKIVLMFYNFDEFKFEWRKQMEQGITTKYKHGNKFDD